MSFYGHDFSAGVSTLRLLCVSTVISAANISVGQAIWSLGAATPGMLLALLRSVALVCAAIFLAAHGAAGLAGAYVFMGVVQTAVQAPFILSLMKRQAAAWAAPQTILERA